jgi:hypothetical protein
MFSELYDMQKYMVYSAQPLQVIKKQQSAFTGLPHAEDLSRAKVNALTTLQQGLYGIASIESELMICQGMTLSCSCIVVLMI